MSNSERGNSQNLLSPSERMTKAWRKMVESGQLQFYMAIGSGKIKNLKIDEKEANGYEYVAEYLQALQEFLEA